MGFEPAILADPLRTGQPPSQLRQSRSAVVSYSGLPFMGLPGPTLSLWRNNTNNQENV